MFTLSVVVGSAILYRDFESADLQRLLKFIFGCISTFIGVYLITSRRPAHNVLKSHQSTPHLNGHQHNAQSEVGPLLTVPTLNGPATSIKDLPETPPQFLGTSFGYHFTGPRVLERKGSLSTLPGLVTNGKQKGELANTLLNLWGSLDPRTGELVQGERMGRTNSDISTQNTSPQENGVNGDTESDIVGEGGRQSWGRNRGYSVV